MLGYAAVAELPISTLSSGSAELNAPANLTATAASSSSIDLAWDDTNSDPENETGTEIERSLTGVGGWALIHTADADETTFTDTGLDDETEYFYRVRAVDATRQSEYSNTDSATTLQAPAPTDTFRVPRRTTTFQVRARTVSHRVPRRTVSWTVRDR